MIFVNGHVTLTLLFGIVNVHLLVPADVNVIPVAVGVPALYPVFGLHVMVIVVPDVALAALADALPPAAGLAVTVIEWEDTVVSTVNVKVVVSVDDPVFLALIFGALNELLMYEYVEYHVSKLRV